MRERVDVVALLSLIYHRGMFLVTERRPVVGSFVLFLISQPPWKKSKTTKYILFFCRVGLCLTIIRMVASIRMQYQIV